MKNIVIATLLTLCISGCHNVNFDEYYLSKNIPNTSYVQSDKAEVIETQSLKKSLAHYLDSGYIVLGTMELNHELIPNRKVASFAAKKGASLVLASISYLNTYTFSYWRSVPKTATAYTRGSGYDTYSSFSYHSTTTLSYTERERVEETIVVFKHRYILLGKKRS